MRIWLLCSVCLMLAACARPVAEIPTASYSSMKNEIRVEIGDILQKYVAAQRRLWTIAAPLLITNAPLCPYRAYTPGFTVYSDFDLPDELRDVAYERLLLGRDATVNAVMPGTQAWDSGIRAGDVVLTMNGKRVRNAAELRARVRKIKNTDAVAFGFIREGKSYSANISFVPICNYKILYGMADREINAFATGRAIYVTQGMMDFANDRELSAVIGHELAHNIMNHIPKEELNTTVLRVSGGLIDGLMSALGANTNIREIMLQTYTHIWSTRFEKEADYVGLYLVARSGGDISAAAPFWRKMAAEHGMEVVQLSDLYVRTHPDTPERFVVLEQTQQEIETKIREGRDLMPDLRTDYPYGKKYWPWQVDDENEPDDSDLNH